MSQAIEGVLFDMDNTLIDWSGFTGDWAEMEYAHLELLYNYLAENARPLNVSLNHFSTVYRDRVVDAWEDSRTTLRAPHMTEIMRTVLAEFGFVPDDTITMRHVMEAYQWLGGTDVVTFPDVPDALQKLIDSGIKIGIVTNAFQPMWLRDVELKTHNLLQYFPDENVRISAADVGYLKPHPQIFHHALEQLGTSAEKTLFVGDNPTADIAGAQSVGMRAVLRVLSDDVPRIARLVVPDAMIHNFDELLRLVDDWEAHA
ncbi:MAG: HAD family hydrolase [Phototrophicaceae bacterium]